MNVLAIPQRTEHRLAKHADIRIFGMDSHGKPVNVPATTVDVSRHGARLTGVDCWDSPGETVGIRCGTAKARYRVVWVGPTGTPIQGQIGVKCVETEKNIWGIEQPDVTDPKQQPVAPIPFPIKRFIDSRRHHQRFIVNGSANVREFSRNIPHWTHLEDLSMGGCYVRTIVPYTERTQVAVTLHVMDMKIETLGRIVVKDPLVGMGIRFTDMSPLDQQRLRQVIDHLVQLGDRTLGRRRT